MQTSLLLLMVAMLFIWLGRFVLGLMRGRVKGSHPVERKFAWIDRTEYPRHFWIFALLQVLLFVVLAWFILGLWNTPLL